MRIRALLFIHWLTWVGSQRCAREKQERDVKFGGLTGEFAIQTICEVLVKTNM